MSRWDCMTADERRAAHLRAGAASREAQGLPPQVTDRPTLARLRDLILGRQRGEATPAPAAHLARAGARVRPPRGRKGGDGHRPGEHDHQARGCPPASAVGAGPLPAEATRPDGMSSGGRS